MDAIDLILSHHTRIRKNLAQLSKSKYPSTFKRSFEKLAAFLISHETMEQKIWYPYLKNHTPLKPIITLLMKEEKTAAKTISMIKKIKPTDVFEEKVLELKKAVAQHAKDEESKLLPKVRKLIEKRELLKLGKDMRAFKKSYDQTHSSK